MSDEKKYSAEYAARMVLKKSYDMIKARAEKKQSLEKKDFSVKGAVQDIHTDTKEVHDVLRETPKGKKDDVLRELRESKKKKSKKMAKKQGVPKGADKETHEKCVKEVKAKGHDKGSAYAICNAAGAGMKKSETSKLRSFVNKVAEKRKNG